MSRNQQAFHDATERRLALLGERCQRLDEEAQRRQFIVELDRFIDWFRLELDGASRRAKSSGDTALMGRWLADQRFFSLVVLHRRALSLGSVHLDLCCDLVRRTGPEWLRQRRNALGLKRPVGVASLRSNKL